MLSEEQVVNCAHCGNGIRPIGSAWIHVATKLVSCRRGKSSEHNGIYRAEPAAILDESQVAEIEALPVHEGDTTEFRRLNSVEIPATQRDALCQTVRALRAEQLEGETCEFCDKPTNDEHGNPLTFLVCGRCWNANVEANRKTITALRDQLVVVTQERDRFSELADKRHDDLCEARRQCDEVARRLYETEQKGCQ